MADAESYSHHYGICMEAPVLTLIVNGTARVRHTAVVQAQKR